MVNYSFGDILIINFPFAEGTGSKRRPVLVLRDTDDEDILVCKITGKNYVSVFDSEIKEWKFSNLLSPSTIRVHKIQTLRSTLIFGKIGQLHSTDKKNVRHKLIELVRV